MACPSLKLPPMPGCLVVGILIGPHALAVARDSARVHYVAEFGVVFMTFINGLEFNLAKLRAMRTLVFGRCWQGPCAARGGATCHHRCS